LVLIVLWLVLVTNDVGQHHFHKHKIYLLRICSIDPASISVKKVLFSSKQHRSTRRNNSLHPGYLTSLVTRTNHNIIETIGIYVRVFRTADHAVQIFIPHRRSFSVDGPSIWNSLPPHVRNSLTETIFRSHRDYLSLSPRLSFALTENIFRSHRDYLSLSPRISFALTETIFRSKLKIHL